MSPSAEAKQLGCKNLKQIEVVTGQSIQTLINWHRNKHDLFKAVCVGVASLSKVEEAS